jgi:hypothetical protein
VWCIEQARRRVLELVLGLGEVGDAGVGLPRPQRLQLVVAEVEPLADEARLVRVHDRPVVPPQLHPHQRATEHLAPHDGVEASRRRRVEVDDAVLQRRLDRAAGDQATRAIGVVDRRRCTDAPRHDRRDQRDGHEGDDGHRHVAQHEPLDRDVVVERDRWSRCARTISHRP